MLSHPTPHQSTSLTASPLGEAYFSSDEVETKDNGHCSVLHLISHLAVTASPLGEACFSSDEVLKEINSNDK